MIVKGQHRSWHVIAQPDHGDVVSEIAAARGNDRFGSPRMFGSLIVAARRPDDRWAVWERQPGVDQDSGNGRPRNAFDIDIPVHLAFFRAMIEAVKGEGTYAAVLASMQAIGLYNNWHRTGPSLRMGHGDTARGWADVFLGHQGQSGARWRPGRVGMGSSQTPSQAAGSDTGYGTPPSEFSNTWKPDDPCSRRWLNAPKVSSGADIKETT